MGRKETVLAWEGEISESGSGQADHLQVGFVGHKGSVWEALRCRSPFLVCERGYSIVSR